MAEQRPLRVIVGLDLTSAVDRVVETGALLAASLRTELSGLFVEDEALSHAVALPFTVLVHRSGTLSPIDSVRLDRTLRLAAHEAERALTLAAERVRLDATFRTVRGRLLGALLAASTERDLIVLGSTLSPALVPKRPGSVVALFDRSALGTPLLDFALAIATARGERLVVLVQRDDDPEPVRAAAAWAERGRATLRAVEVIEVESIAKALEREHASLLVSGAHSAWLGESSLKELRAQAGCPLVLLR